MPRHVVKLWSFSQLKKYFFTTNLIAGGCIFDFTPGNRKQRVNNFLCRLNVTLGFFELVYFTFFVPFDLLNFITTGSKKFTILNSLSKSIMLSSIRWFFLLKKNHSR